MFDHLSYDPMTGHITSTKTRKIAGSKGANGYMQIKVAGKVYYQHRLAWYLHFGYWPENQIDHINGVKTDNRISNLRLATNKQNAQNTGLRRDNTSGVRGVYYEKGRKSPWKARIKIDGKFKFLGYFVTKGEAETAYQTAAEEHFAAFKRN